MQVYLWNNNIIILLSYLIINTVFNFNYAYCERSQNHPSILSSDLGAIIELFNADTIKLHSEKNCGECKFYTGNWFYIYSQFMLD